MYQSEARILIVDDEQSLRWSLFEVLEDHYKVGEACNGEEALDIVKQEAFDLVLLDVMMPGWSGIETLKRLKAYDSSLEVVMVSGNDRAREAADAIKSGAFDYITKPFEEENVLAVVDKALQHRGLLFKMENVAAEVAARIERKQIVTRAKCMESVLSTINKVASTDSNVLITGESGTGKELVALQLHLKSPRADYTFMPINCAAIPRELMESELFGHEKGAFTGAKNSKLGKFEAASGGTVFMDELGEMDMALQAKLLRVLQDREVYRVGANAPRKVDVRIVTATNKNLAEMVKAGKFREDLYFRLRVIPIELPALRKRTGDIPLLATFFLDKFNAKYNKNIPGLSRKAMRILEDYPWPGNVRELMNYMERVVVMGESGKPVDEGDLFTDWAQDLSEPEKLGLSLDKIESLKQATNTFLRDYISRVLDECEGNQTQAATKLKIHRNTLLNKMKELGLS